MGCRKIPVIFATNATKLMFPRIKGSFKLK
jgi:hypothetical protein